MPSSRAEEVGRSRRLEVPFAAGCVLLGVAAVGYAAVTIASLAAGSGLRAPWQLATLFAGLLLIPGCLLILVPSLRGSDRLVSWWLLRIVGSPIRAFVIAVLLVFLAVPAFTATATAAARGNAAVLGFTDPELTGINLRGKDLRGERFAARSLGGANLVGADLSRVSFAAADLRGAALAGADLHAADLSAARLEGAILVGADLSDARLSAAELRGADLRGADLSRAILAGARLDSASLEGAIVSRGALMPNQLASLGDADRVCCVRPRPGGDGHA
jgi:hypothetical protein